ncbi:MAG: metal-sensitive transcriptional regulator [Clostridia bacterium]|nr:metal-sensitive transcriptional regulator [Clostridia bacterium]
MEYYPEVIIMENGKSSEHYSDKQDILKRLRRIEGQVKGIQKMVEEDKYCVDILTQVAAVRAAINKVGGLVLEKHTKTCMKDALESRDQEKIIEEFVDTVQKFLKFVD